MRNLLSPITLAGLALLLATGIGTTAHAEEAEAVTLVKPAPRQGYFIGGSVALAYTAARLDDTWYPTWNGSAIRLFWGQELCPWIDVGLVAEYIRSGGKRRSFWGGGLGLAAQLHPREPWSFRVEAGFGGLRLTDSKDIDNGLEGAYGAIYTLAAGYEFYPFYEGPYASGAFGIAPTVALRVQPGSDTYLTVWFGVEFKWWSGHPKNQLDLPIDEAFAEE